MKLKLNIHDVGFKDKPSKDDIAKISKNIRKLKYKKEVTISEFAKNIAIEGKSCVLGTYSNDRNTKVTDEIESQQLVMLDFDNNNGFNEFSIDDLKQDSFIMEHACFYYKTFGDSKSKWDRFRIVFILDKKVKEKETIEHIYNCLFELYPMSDKSIGQPNRIFFGSTSGVEKIKFSNRLSIADLKKELDSKNKKIASTKVVLNKDEILTIDTPNYKLFMYKRFDLLKLKYKGLHEIECTDNENVRNYLITLDMVDFLELDVQNTANFYDIFHDEKTPSASIFVHNELGIQYYKCHSASNKFTGDLIRVVGQLIGISSPTGTINKLIEILGIKMNYNSELGQRQQDVNIFRRKLLDDSLRFDNPNLYAYVKKYKHELAATLDILYDYYYIDPKTKELKFISYFNINTITRYVNRAVKGAKVSQAKMWDILSLAVVTELILKIPSNEIPENLSENIRHHKLMNQNLRESNVYSPSTFDSDTLIRAEEISEVLNISNTEVKSLGYEIIYRLFGEEKAKKDFPQSYEPLVAVGKLKTSNIDVNLTSKSVKYEQETSKIIMKSINSKGYILEEEVIKLSAKKLKIKQSVYKDFYKKFRFSILQNYDLNRKIVNKELIDIFNIKDKVRNKQIIYKKS